MQATEQQQEFQQRRRHIHEEGLITLPEADWTVAKRRRDVIAPLANLKVVGRAAAEAAADQLGIKVRQVYELI